LSFVTERVVPSSFINFIVSAFLYERISRRQEEDSDNIYADEEGMHSSVAARYVKELDYPRQSNETESGKHKRGNHIECNRCRTLKVFRWFVHLARPSGCINDST
jgi:hypothetical protein